ncbi:hypothetical protein GCM10010435_02760 [Winogradskya consettensis]|uniref:Uncharacterized protein n=1 Tax=Winogradskya consettensis TaxID=113560 RepID=A0A919S6W5_9ACTN|nr:hypothetical protein Aco04nite_00190 [Actinoplanes consettensis]
MFPSHQVGISESGLPRSCVVRNQSSSCTGQPFEVDDASTLGPPAPARTPKPAIASKDTPHEH